ncbi:hypothetical protein GH714_021048 [Hevea brasiliensis]|uniref:Uncharacterized protein n=1 Tax=Hevea brasiliensis TaxID=3981 RepID=A0A6A6N2R4_HEVBR|nr:hypothetical protein GH714_021048 [Hevea brasiliensis]
MDLSCSEDLIRIPDLSSTAPNLEFIYLCRCRSLVEIPSSLQYLSKLTELYLHSSLESASSFLFQDDNKFYNLVFDNCVNLEKNKVMEDVFEAHLLGETVFLHMAGGEVPERMRYKNQSGSLLTFILDLRHLIAFSFCAVLRPTNYSYRLPNDIISSELYYRDKSGHLHSHRFFFFDYRQDFQYSSEHLWLWFSHNNFNYFDEDGFVLVAFHFHIQALALSSDEWIIKCGVHPIYEHEDGEEGKPPLERLEQNDFLNHRRRTRKRNQTSSIKF